MLAHFLQNQKSSIYPTSKMLFFLLFKKKTMIRTNPFIKMLRSRTTGALQISLNSCLCSLLNSPSCDIICHVMWFFLNRSDITITSGCKLNSYWLQLLLYDLIGYEVFLLFSFLFNFIGLIFRAFSWRYFIRLLLFAFNIQ